MLISSKPQVKKAPALPKEILENILKKYIMPCLNNIYSIDLVLFRSTVLMMLQFALLSRFSDLVLIEPRDLHFTKDKEGNNTCQILFRKRKNDQIHLGNTSVLSGLQDSENTSVVPCYVKILQVYLRRTNLDLDCHKNCKLFHRITDVARSKKPEYRPSKLGVSANQALKMFRKLLTDEKIPNPSSYTLISSKAAGVDFAYDQGLTEEEVRDLGGWASIQTSLYYKRNVMGRKQKISAKMRL